MKFLENNVYVLADLALDIARTDPHRLAVVEPAGRDLRGRRHYRRYSYKQLSDDAESVAPGLREIGIGEGVRTVCMTPPSYEACVLHTALTRVGAMQVWIDPSVGYLNVGERLRRIEPEAFVGLPVAHLGRLAFGWGSRFLRKTVTVGSPGFPGTHSIQSLRRKAPQVPSAPRITPESEAAILYTTGSTGPAKPTLYYHKNFCEVLRTVHRSWRFNEDESLPVDMPAFPAFFFVGLSAGGTVVVPPINFVTQGPARANPRDMLEVINDCGVKSMFGSPVLLENLGSYALEHGIQTPTFKRVIGGGAPIVASSVRPLLEMMGEGGEVFSNYGCTEALPSTEMSARETLSETWERSESGGGICIGRPFEGIEVKVVSIAEGPVANIGDTRELPAGEIGEILIRGAHVSPEYFRDPENTKKNKIPDGQGGVWHRVGDAGYFDDRGRLWYCGRVSQRVKARGGALYSLQCEPIFDAHPKVRRSGLVGVPAGAYETPVICVEPVEGVRASELPKLREELLTLARKHTVTLGIEELLFSKALPVDPRHNSKIERPRLAKWAAGKLPRRRGNAPSAAYVGGSAL